MIYFHGSLAKKYGDSFNIQVENAIEAYRALSSQLPGFSKIIQEGEWRIKRGDIFLDESTLHLYLGDNDIHFIPMPLGSKDKGIGKIIVGVFIIAISFMFPGAIAALPTLTVGGTTLGVTTASLALFGAAIALGGVASLLSPVPTVDDYNQGESATTERNGVLRGQGNTVRPGQAIPLLYGSMLTGSQIINLALRTTRVPLEEIIESTNNVPYIMVAGTSQDPIDDPHYKVGVSMQLNDLYQSQAHVPPIKYDNFGEIDRKLFRGEMVGVYQQFNVERGVYYIHLIVRRTGKSHYAWLQEIKIEEDVEGTIVTRINKTTADETTWYNPNVAVWSLPFDPHSASLHISSPIHTRHAVSAGTEWRFLQGGDIDNPPLVAGNSYTITLGWS